MRLLRLDLTRYGHLTDVRLAFPPEATLHVVLGANEAGKSTALAAIGDALFGFPHVTPHAFLHDTAQLRLGFEVETGEGIRAAFVRRKGRKDTLLDAAESPVPEVALTRLLGGAGRELFTTAFGLNGETLRRGALALLQSGGEAGESLLAGMGLPHLRKALDRLDAEAKTLHGDGRGRRLLAIAAEAWNEKRRAAEDAAIRPREWADTTEELHRIEAELAEATQDAGARMREASRLQRVRRVLPVLTALAARRRDVAEVAEAPALPADAAATLHRVSNALRQAEEDMRRETAEADRLDAEHAAVPEDDGILAVQDEIDALAASRGAAEGAAGDLPAVERRIEEHRAAVAEAAGQLGRALDPEALRDAVPKSAERQGAQGLIRRRTELATTLQAADAALRSAERRRDAARATLEAAPVPPAAAPLRRAIEAARGEGPLDRHLAEAERALANAARQASAALATLPLWSGDAAALAACPVPLLPECDAVALRIARARAEHDSACRDAGALAAEIAALEAEIVHLARGGTVPTPEVIAAERSRRDGAWRRIRRGLDGEEPVDRALPDQFEGFRDAADRLADARADDAARVNDYAAKSARLVLLGGRRSGVAAAAADSERRLEAVETAWQALWAPSGIVPQGEAAMAEWRRARTEALRLSALEAEARQRRDDVAARLAEARATVLTVLPEAAAPTLAASLAAADASCTAAEAAEAAHRKLAEAAAQEAARVEEARARREDAAAALAAFEGAWRAAATGLGLPANASVESVEAALGAWARVAEAAEAWRSDEGRIAGMRSTLDAFAVTTRDVLARLGIASEEAAPIAAARLARRLAAARDAHRDALALAKQAQARRAAAAEAQRRRDAAEGELAALLAVAAAADLPALEVAIRQAERRTALQAGIAALEDDLVRQGDGLDEGALRAEADGADVDAAQARLAEIEAGQPLRDARLTRLGAARQDVESRLAAMRKGRDAAAHAQDARHHLAEAQSAAERFARIHLARELLRAGIERIRQDRQEPLLRAAGGHFALLTEGRYVRLTTDWDEAGRTVLRAVRANGDECPVEALSEGTRDQLYLALRAAAVEAHAAGAESLPFIADDLLASFDDPRAAAAIALLARLGRTTQVILFTHHAHIAALARRQPGVHVQHMPEGAASVALPAA